MIGDKDTRAATDDEDDFEELEDTVALDARSKSANSDNVGEPSVELNVEEIVSELEAEMGIVSQGERVNSRKRLEELLEERRAARELQELDEFASEDI